jgi:hypothetical protein
MDRNQIGEDRWTQEEMIRQVVRLRRREEPGAIG